MKNLDIILMLSENYNTLNLKKMDLVRNESKGF